MKDPSRSSEKMPLRWKCALCGYRVGFLPPNLDLPCPKCGGSTAKEFLHTPFGWLNEGCPGWGDEEAMPEDHVPGDKNCRCEKCTVRRAEQAEWIGERKEDR